MSKLLVAFCLTISSFASAAEHQANLPADRLTVAVDRMGTEFIRFQVCTQGECKPLTGETGIYRIKDLEQRAHHLLNGSPENEALIAKMKRKLRIAGILGGGLTVVAHGTAMYLTSQGLMNMTGTYALIAADFIGLTPVVMAFFYPYMIVPLQRQADQALGSGLGRAMVEDFDKKTESHFRAHVENVRASVSGLQTVSFCEAKSF